MAGAAAKKAAAGKIFVGGIADPVYSYSNSIARLRQSETQNEDPITIFA